MDLICMRKWRNPLLQPKENFCRISHSLKYISFVSQSDELIIQNSLGEFSATCSCSSFVDFFWLPIFRDTSIFSINELVSEALVSYSVTGIGLLILSEGNKFPEPSFSDSMSLLVLGEEILLECKFEEECQSKSFFLPYSSSTWRDLLSAIFDSHEVDNMRVLSVKGDSSTGDFVIFLERKESASVGYFTVCGKVVKNGLSLQKSPLKVLEENLDSSGDHTQMIKDTCFSSNRFFVLKCTNEVAIWNLRQGKILCHISLNSIVNSSFSKAQISPTGTILLLSSNSGILLPIELSGLIKDNNTPQVPVKMDQSSPKQPKLEDSLKTPQKEAKFPSFLFRREKKFPLFSLPVEKAVGKPGIFSIFEESMGGLKLTWEEIFTKPKGLSDEFGGKITFEKNLESENLAVIGCHGNLYFLNSKGLNVIIPKVESLGESLGEKGGISTLESRFLNEVRERDGLKAALFLCDLNGIEVIFVIKWGGDLVNFLLLNSIFFRFSRLEQKPSASEFSPPLNK